MVVHEVSGFSLALLPPCASPASRAANTFSFVSFHLHTSADKCSQYTVFFSSIMTTNYNEEDLIELVKAIKFANPDYDCKSVHQEISQTLSKTETFEFLSSVKVEERQKRQTGRTSIGLGKEGGRAGAP